VSHVLKAIQEPSTRAVEEAEGFAASSDVPPELRGAKMLILADRQSERGP
jgi:hypothetical protein